MIVTVELHIPPQSQKYSTVQYVSTKRVKELLTLIASSGMPDVLDDHSNIPICDMTNKQFGTLRVRTGKTL